MLCSCTLTAASLEAKPAAADTRSLPWMVELNFVNAEASWVEDVDPSAVAVATEGTRSPPRMVVPGFADVEVHVADLVDPYVDVAATEDIDVGGPLRPLSSAPATSKPSAHATAPHVGNLLAWSFIVVLGLRSMLLSAMPNRRSEINACWSTSGSAGWTTLFQTILMTQSPSSFMRHSLRPYPAESGMRWAGKMLACTGNVAGEVTP